MRYYTSVNRYLQQRFGCKVYKVALSGGFTWTAEAAFSVPKGEAATLPVILHSR